MISVIIPAYNEASVIERTLRSVIAAVNQACEELSSTANSSGTGNPDGEGPKPEIIVACNGCHDETPQLAAKFGEAVQVIEIAKGSKIAALNAGDQAATLFPRFYLDADIELSKNALAAVSTVLLGGTVHAAAPQMVCDTRGASWPVRAFYKTWLSRPYQRQGHVGSGFVGISHSGRDRFGTFPDLIADDEFIRRHFTPAERRVVSGASFTIKVPKTSYSLIKVKTRSRLGTLQLTRNMPELSVNIRERAASNPDPIDQSAGVGDQPSPLAKAAYGAITLAARSRAKWQYRRGQFGRWERDETTR